MLEQRLTIRMTSYWERLKGEREVPNIELFNAATIQDLWPNCMKLSVFQTGDNITYSYDFTGAELIKGFGQPPSGTRVSSKMAHLPTVKMLQKMDIIVRNPVVTTDEGQFINTKNQVVKYRSCMLPFGTTKENITHLILGFSWRTF